MSEIIRIAPENIAPLWKQLEPMIIGALRNTPTHTAEDVRKALLGMQSHLFAKMNNGLVESFNITMFCVHPQGVWLHIWLTASIESVPFDVAAFLESADEWRARNGCRGIQMTGARGGWIKKFPQAQVEGVTIRLTME